MANSVCRLIACLVFNQCRFCFVLFTFVVVVVAVSFLSHHLSIDGGQRNGGWWSFVYVSHSLLLLAFVCFFSFLFLLLLFRSSVCLKLCFFVCSLQSNSLNVKLTRKEKKKALI